MDWKFLITFAIGLGVYFVGLIIWVLIKRYRNKKSFDKEQKDNERKDDNGKE